MEENRNIGLFYLVATAAYALTAVWVAYERCFPGGKDIIVCPIRRFLGIECPACGTTRSLLHVLNGDFLTAACININGLTAAAGMVIGAVLLAYDAVGRQRLTYRLCMKLNAFASTSAGKVACVLYVAALMAGKFIGGMITT